ncbi:MAG: DUF1566 domain-containing protein [Patescibacteria group bacterium]|jgi:hypothetical protein|nr:DUF1566 domain-containing protein [Patescibacteria group bacterium]
MKLKKHLHNLLKKISLAIIIFILPLITQAQYTNKELIPGQSPTNNLETYLNNIYNFGIAIAAILAVFMIALGAFIYIFTSAGNASKMMDAKDMIKNALIGLALVLVAFLILFIINPDLVGGTISGPSNVIKNVVKVPNASDLSSFKTNSNNNANFNVTESVLSPNNNEVVADEEGKVILNWDEVSDSENYVVTVKDITNEDNLNQESESGDILVKGVSDEKNKECEGDNYLICNEKVQGSSYEIEVQPGHIYEWEVSTTEKDLEKGNVEEKAVFFVKKDEEFYCFDDDEDGFDKCDIGEEGDDGLAKDCNDSDSEINPGKSEICIDNKDNNCNGETDEDGCVQSDEDFENPEAGEIDIMCEKDTIKVEGWVQDPVRPNKAYDFFVYFYNQENVRIGRCYTTRILSDCEFYADYSGEDVITASLIGKFGGMKETKIKTTKINCGDVNNTSFFEVDPNPIVLSGSLTACYVDNKTDSIRTSVRFVWDVSNNQENISNVQIRLGSADGKIIASGGIKGEHTTEQLEINDEGVRLYLTDAKNGNMLAFDKVRIDARRCVFTRGNDLGVCFPAESWAYEKQSILDNSSFCPFDKVGVNRHKSLGKKLVPECTPTQKCEYICDEGYEFKQSDDTWYCVPSDTPPAPIVDPNPNDLCGPAGSSDENNPVEYLATDIRFRGNLCSTGEPIPYNTTFPYKKDTKVEWECKDESGDESQKCYAYRSNNLFSCSGNIPYGVSKCYEDDKFLVQEEEWTSIGDSSLNCTDEKKCEYYFPRVVQGYECGNADGKFYEAEDESFGDDVLCSKGYVYPKDLKFPQEGGIANWHCSEKRNPNFLSVLFYDEVSSCSASRKSSETKEGCGDASGSYQNDTENFRSNNFCSNEYSLSSSEIKFPISQNSSVEWTCKPNWLNRIFARKKEVVCSAVRGEIINEVDYIPCFGDLPDKAVKCEEDEKGSEIPQEWKLIGSSSDGCTNEIACEYYIPQEEFDDQNDIHNETKATGLIPDTGAEKCVVSNRCIEGEDATRSINEMSFTKLGKNGNDIPEGNTTSKWYALKDNVTGLVWEVKTNDNSIQDADNKFSIEEAEEYIEKMNQANYNGRNDWRLPTAKEVFYFKYFGKDYQKGRAFVSNLSCFLYDNKPASFDMGRSFLVSNKSTFNTPMNSNFYLYRGRFGYFQTTNAYIDGDEEYYIIAVSGKETESEFIDNGNGTVTDKNTGLMWMKQNFVSESKTVFGAYGLDGATEACANLELEGHDDWRLPNIKELASLVDFNKNSKPFMNDVFSKNITHEGEDFNYSRSFWSSTVDSNWSVVGYLFNFDNMHTSKLYFSGPSLVRCVRGNN